MRFASLLLLVVLTPATATAQTGIQGEVFVRGGSPEALTVVLTHGDAPLAAARVDATGRYHLDAPPGVYDVTINARSYGHTVDNVIVEPYGPTRIDFEMAEGEATRGEFAPPRVEGWTRPVVYVVSAGDTVRDLARRFGITPVEIQIANDLASGAELRSRQRLVIPSRALTGEETLAQLEEMIAGDDPGPIEIVDDSPEVAVEPPRVDGPPEAIDPIEPLPFRGPEGRPRPLAEIRTGTDRAILFATDTYDRPGLDDLANPISDAEAIGRELREAYGFEVEIVRDPTRDEIFATLERYSRLDTGEDDQLFVFFAGHGTFVRSGDTGRGFVIPRDGHPFSRASWVSYDNIAAELDAMPAHRVLLVLDVCFGGSFVRQTRSGDPYGTASPQDIMRRYGPFKSRLALTSGAEEYVSDGRPGEHSPFTYHLLGALRGPGGPDGDGLLTFPELADAAMRVRGPSPLAGDFGRSEPGGTFFLIPREASGEPEGTPMGGE